MNQMMLESNRVSTMAVIRAGTLSWPFPINTYNTLTYTGQEKPDSPTFSLYFTEKAITLIKGEIHPELLYR